MLIIWTWPMLSSSSGVRSSIVILQLSFSSIQNLQILKSDLCIQIIVLIMRKKDQLLTLSFYCMLLITYEAKWFATDAGTSSLSKNKLWINPLCLFPELTALIWAGWLSIVKWVSAPPSKNSPAVSTFALSTQTSRVSFSNTTRCWEPPIVTVQVFKIYQKRNHLSSTIIIEQIKKKL